MAGRLLERLRASRSGVAMTEFALAAPFVLGTALFGVETAMLTVTHMQVNAVTTQIADNASRIGDFSMLENRKIYESDINDLLLGAQVHLGMKLNLYENGRVIVSSLETRPDIPQTRQWLHWQRCKGKKVWPSSYGNAGDGYNNGSFGGMGPTGNKVKAQKGDAVMFVEVAYDYEPLFSEMFIKDKTIKAYAAYTVRSDRDLTQIYQRDDLAPDPVQTCDKNDAF